MSEAQPQCPGCTGLMKRVEGYFFLYRCSACKRTMTEQEFVIKTGIRKQEIAEWEASRPPKGKR